MQLYRSETYRHDITCAMESVVQVEALENKKILITGASGLIGSFIIDVLLMCNQNKGLNIEIYALGRNRNRLISRFQGVATDHLYFIEQDINEELLFEGSFDYIIHAAGNAYPAAFRQDPVGTIMSNIQGTARLLEYGLKHHTSRLLFVSSGEVYGNGDVSLDAFHEEYSGYVNPVEVRSCYPMGKRAAETLCVAYTQQFGLDTVIARPCHTYGPNITADDNRASAQFMNNVINGQDIILKSAGNQLRSYCYIADCASALLSILINGKSCEAYNVANSNAKVTIAEFAKIVADKAGRKRIMSIPDKIAIAEQTPIAKQVLDSSKLESLGWKGQYSVEKGIEHTLLVLAGK